MLRSIMLLAALAGAFASPRADAQICAPFTDVAASNIFCGNIQWMFNRGVTQGCGPNVFCPADLMPREQMAAFLNRLADKVVFQQGGNAFGAPANLGTTDNQPLDVRVNNVRVARFEPNSESPNVVAGYFGNNASTGVVGAAVGGGGTTGNLNVVTGDYGTVAGGRGNEAGSAGTVGGGAGNTSADEATVSGGVGNEALGYRSTIVGGAFNDTTPAATLSVVVGGGQNTAAAPRSFAAGNFAQANGERCVVFSLWQFGPGKQCFGIAGLFIIGAPAGFAVDYFTQRADGSGGGTRYIGIGRVPGQTIATWTGAFLSDAGVWNNASDAQSKDSFSDIDKRGLLDKLASLPIRSWRYKTEDDSIRHIGPTAQDFMAAFGLGRDGKTIGTVDADGVALAAIQALNAKLEERLNEQTREIAELRRLNDELRALVLGSIRR